MGELRSARPDAVQRRGEQVLRATGPQTPAVHALLRHLETVGFRAAPRVIGIEGGGREVLTFVDGEDGHHAGRPELHSDRALAEVARLVRAFHEAVADFVPPPDARWQFLEGAPREGIVCHNDLAPVNTVFRDGSPVAFIDWDYAAPAPAVWDLACAVWSFVPLSDDAFCHRHGYPTGDRGPRLRLFCDAYGLDDPDRSGLLDVVRARQQAMLETVRRGAARGHPTYTQVWQATQGQRWRDEIAYLDANRERWQSFLD